MLFGGPKSLKCMVFTWRTKSALVLEDLNMFQDFPVTTGKLQQVFNLPASTEKTCLHISQDYSEYQGR